MSTITEEERLRRWRLMLGSEADTAVSGAAGQRPGLAPDDRAMDNVLEALYDSDRSAGLGSSCPNVNRWLGDIRHYFPSSVVHVMQRDALEKLNLRAMLLEPETLQSVDADIHLVATLLTLKSLIPKKTKETARLVVQKVVRELERRLRNPLLQAVRGSLNRASRTRRPRAAEIDWHRTIRRNLHNYIPEKRTVIAERLVGYSRRRSALREVVLCVDQSGSMASSVVHASVFGAVLASLSSLRTRMVVFDTEVADLSDHLADPVDLLFGTQLGGGTDINRALGYCRQRITRPSKTILVLISDLYEGGDAREMLRHAAALVASGVHCICLLALGDDGAPSFHEGHASSLAGLGIPSFACTPDQFPDLMAAAINRSDIGAWCARNQIVTA